MQVFANLATAPEQYKSKSTGRFYWQFRIAESQKGPSGASDATFYTVRVMKPEDPALSKGDFVKVTGSLKTDYYLSREGKPTGTLLIIAFDATKIAKPSALKDEGKQSEHLQVPGKRRRNRYLHGLRSACRNGGHNGHKSQW